MQSDNCCQPCIQYNDKRFYSEIPLEISYHFNELAANCEYSFYIYIVELHLLIMFSDTSGRFYLSRHLEQMEINYSWYTYRKHRKTHPMWSFYLVGYWNILKNSNITVYFSFGDIDSISSILNRRWLLCFIQRVVG